MSADTPVAAPNPADPGDETAKKYRYQYAYGVILWAASYRQGRDYISLWCEQHEDFLSQISEKLFDGFQIKTLKSGNWQWNHEEIINTVKRFVYLDEQYPDQMREFFFVSNAECSASEAVDRIHLSPVSVLTLLRSQPYGPYPEYCEKCLNDLATRTECSRASVAAVLKKMGLIVGPTEQSFEAEIQQNHIPHVAGCGHLIPSQLASLLDSLIGRVWQASSKSYQGPERHYAIVNGNFGEDPQLLDKRISVNAFSTFIEAFKLPRFEYLRRFQSVKLLPERSEASILQQKMAGAGLTDYFDGLQRQTISTERHLFELQAKEPERGPQVVAQLESVVLRVCNDAHLKHTDDQRDFGLPMMRQVNEELKTIAESQPDEVHRQSYDALLGMSGLLAESCKVWWSKKFKVEGKS